jgi:hypothetical protein
MLVTCMGLTFYSNKRIIIIKTQAHGLPRFNGPQHATFCHMSIQIIRLTSVAHRTTKDRQALTLEQSLMRRRLYDCDLAGCERVDRVRHLIRTLRWTYC